MYDEHVMSTKPAPVWCNAFTEECTNLQDEHCVGHAHSATEDNTVHGGFDTFNTTDGKNSRYCCGT